MRRKREQPAGGPGDSLWAEFSEQNLRDVISNTYELLIVARTDGHPIGFGPGWEKVLGWTPAELQERPFREFVHPNDLPAGSAVLDGLRSGAEPCHFELRLRHRDSSYRWIRWTALSFPAQARICAFGHDITKEKQAEEALRESERRLSMAFTATSDAIWEWNPARGAVYYSPRWFTMLGYEDRAFPMEPSTWRQLVHPEDLPVVVEAIAEALGDRSNRGYTAEVRMRARDGGWRWILGRGNVVLRDEAGNPLLLSGTNTDITRRKELDAELQRLTKIISDSPEPVFAATPHGRVVYSNAAARALLGFDDARLSAGLNLQDLFPEWAVRALNEQGIPAACDAGSWQSELAAVDSTGSEIPIQLVALAHRDRAGNLEYLSFSLRDIRVQKQTLAALRESERRFRTIFESAPYAIVILDLEGRHIDVNQRFLEGQGVTREEVIGRRSDEIPNIFVPDTRGRGEELFQELVSTGSIEGWEGTLRRRSDGAERTVVINSRLITLGGELCTISMSVDISQLRQMERQMRQAQKMDAIGRLAGGVAHDFNNLLTVIGGYTALALEQMPEDDPLRVQLGEVSKASGRATQLTRQLLAFSRKEAVEPELVDLGQAVQESERMLRRLIGANIVIETRVAPSLPPVLVDVTQIGQVLMNLVVNARDAMPAGGKIEIATSRVELSNGQARALDLKPGLFVRLRVQDNGTGMDEETQGRIFEPFFTTKAAGQGTGLGLSIVYGIVKQSRGRIRVHSRLREGTCFEIFLPAAATDSTARTAVDGTEQLPRGSGAILLVEDDEALRAFAGQVLTSAGYRVISAADGRQALSLGRHHAAELVALVTDMALPEFDGRTIARELLSARPALPIVFMSGYSSGVSMDERVPAECDEFLHKPFSPLVLLRAVRRAIDGHNLRT